MQVSQVNLFELVPIKLASVQIGSLDLLVLPQHRSHIQCKLVQLVRVYSVSHAHNALTVDLDILFSPCFAANLTGET